MIAEHTPDGDLCPECKGMGTIHAFWNGTKTTYYHCDNCGGKGRLPRCGICGELLQKVRDGKWQCNNEHGEEQGG